LTRYELLTQWTKNFFNDEPIIEPASSDASFRHYYRVKTSKKSLIAMDAPPDKEDISSFIAIAKKLRQDDIRVPNLYEVNSGLGFILMEDFGSTTYSDAFTETNYNDLYKNALSTLLTIQKKCLYKDIPRYTSILLLNEVSLFEKWYLNKYKKIILNSKEKNDLSRIFNMIIESNVNQQQCFVHRDFHCRNLMLIDGEVGPGIIDFQDAVNGPIVYDLVSLLKDAYFELKEDFILDMVIRYWEAMINNKLIPKNEFADFFKSFEWMGVQRHLKVLGIFARLYLRDNKDQYLNNLPLVEKYLIATTQRYKELFPLRDILNKATAK
jgi:aminoglycoside/choline kinase family phosphotransferase